MKTCTKCSAAKSLSEFDSQPRNTDGRSGYCKTCRNTRARELWAINPARGRASAAKQREAHPEKVKDRIRRWRKDNIGKLRSDKAQWKRDHPAQNNAQCAKRKASKLKATPKWANQFFIEEIYDLAQRRTKATGFKWEVDHIVPLQHPLVQGLHCEQNLQVIPARLNRRKHNRYWPDMP